MVFSGEAFLILKQIFSNSYLAPSGPIPLSRIEKFKTFVLTYGRVLNYLKL